MRTPVAIAFLAGVRRGLKMKIASMICLKFSFARVVALLIICSLLAQADLYARNGVASGRLLPGSTGLPRGFLARRNAV